MFPVDMLAVNQIIFHEIFYLRETAFALQLSEILTDQGAPDVMANGPKNDEFAQTAPYVLARLTSMGSVRLDSENRCAPLPSKFQETASSEMHHSVRAIPDRWSRTSGVAVAPFEDRCLAEYSFKRQA